MSEKTHSSRLSSYKNAGHGTTDLRRKRAELSVALRKQARDEQLLKRRALSPEAGEEVHEEKVYTVEEIVQELSVALRKQARDEQLLKRRALSPEAGEEVHEEKVYSVEEIVQELSVALRKQARDEQLLKRRALSPEAGEEVHEEKVYSVEEIVQGLRSGDLAAMTAYARAARRMLSKEQNPPITPMVNAGIIKPLVDALERDDCPDLQFEASWAITNIASGTHENTMAVVDGGAIPKLVALLAQGGVVGEQSAWALGNIAGDGPQTRDVVLSHGALTVLLPLCTPNTPASQLRTAVWTYSNFCRRETWCYLMEHSLCYSPSALRTLLQASSGLLCGPTVTSADDDDESAWALGNIAGDGPQTRDVVLSHGALTVLLPLCTPNTPASQLRTAVWTYSNFCRNKNPLVKFDYVAPALPYISELLEIADKDVLADACWALSYLTDGPNERIEAVQATPRLLSRTVALLSHGSPAVRTPALRAVGNMLTGSDEQVSKYLLPADTCWALSYLTDGPNERIEAVQATPRLLSRTVALLSHGSPAVRTPALRAVGNMLTGSDEQVSKYLLPADTCWALSYLTDGPNERIEAVQATPRLLSRTVALLSHGSPAVRTPALRAVGNMLTGSDEQTDRCLDAGCLEHIIELLRCGKPSLMKEAAWAVSNILAGTQPQIQRAIDSGVLVHLLHVLATEDIK
ncbi:hypothetical protein PYW07_011488 [Mythimna separata]|uniref:IBB domain-containing protein n=1 Tax=Mythimna separata TaxID=271217 RepID=A0AAD7Y9I5_MYTSE|nr:hypothetical protein PYW07_011488 [Mythimna separata]